MEELIRLNAFADPDPFSIGLAMIAYRHWEQFGNVLIAEMLVPYMLQLQMTGDDIVDELMQEDSMLGKDRDERFAAFVARCGTDLRHQSLLDRLKPKTGADAKKVKI